uniref:Myb-like domain-containing protein n=1 Tax=Leersia perrieri TaxID=77586 RepID=A0A0D9VMN8_9ORYZ
MSSKFMITYKRKRVTSHVYAADGRTTLESPGASSSVPVSSLAPKHEVAADNNMLHGDNFSTSTKQQDVFDSMQEVVKEESPKQSATGSGKERADLKSRESLSQKEQPEICSISTTIGEGCENKLECTDDTNNQSLVSSSAHADRTTNQAEDSKASASVGVNSHQKLNNTAKPSQSKSRFSHLLTFRRRVKSKAGLEGPAAASYSGDNDKHCSTLTCNPPSSPLDSIPLFKQTGGSSFDVEDKVIIAGTSNGQSVIAEHLLEQKSTHIPKLPVHHMVPLQPAEDSNQNSTPEDDAPVSGFTSVQEISELDARVEDSNKTSADATEVPKVIEVKGDGHGNGQTSSLQSPRKMIDVNLSKPTNRIDAADLLESQGSTKNVPIIVLDDDTDERGKEHEKSEVLDQLVQEKNKSRLSLGQINLNLSCVELTQERLLSLDETSVYKLQDQDQYVHERKQMPHPVERLFFTKEKETMHGKQHHEGTSTMHNSYSNFFDPAPSSSSWNAGKLKETSSMPSELKFRILDKAPEFNLDLGLDSFLESSVSARRHDKLFRGGTSSGSHFLTERLGTYSYKRHSAPWSEEELDFLWIGVRRYGTSNWNAMLRDRRLRFLNSRNAEDLAKQWDKEQRNLLGVDLLQSIRSSARGPPPPSHIPEDYVASSSWSGCSKSPFLSAPTDLSLGDMYLQNARTSERGHHLSNLGMLNLHATDNGPRNLSLGGFPVASSPYGRNSSRSRRASKLPKSYYDNKAVWCQDPSERVPPFLPMNPEPINNLPEWLTKDAEMAGKSRLDAELWPSMQAAGHSAAVQLNDMKPHVLPDESLKRPTKRKAEWCGFSKKLFQTGDVALDLNQRAAAMAGPLGAPGTSDTGASSEETVSDS